MRILLCLILILSPFFSTSLFADRGPAVSPIVEISAEDNSPVPPQSAIPYDFSNYREVASYPQQSQSYLPLVSLMIALPFMIWMSVMFRLNRDLKKREHEIDNLTYLSQRSKESPTPRPITGEEDAEDSYKKAS